MKSLQQKKLFFYIGTTILLLLTLLSILIWKTDVFKTVVINSGYSVHYDYEELIDRSHLIVRGKVTAKSDPFTIIPTNGADESLHTDYSLQISDVLRGSKNSGDTVTVRVQGGETLTRVEYNEVAPEIKVGDEVIAFLYQPNVGAPTFTKGDHYYIVAFDQGWFKRQENSETFLGEQPKELNWTEISSFIPAYSAEHPIDYNRTRKEAMQRYQERLKSGEYTQEEYDKAVANLDVYATVKK